MSYFTDLLHNLPELLSTVGHVGLFVIVFVESGLLIGFFLPGDSLLFTAGLLASQGILNIWWTMALTVIAAITGDSLGYYIGKKLGPALFKKEDSLLFKKKHIERTQHFFDKHGGKTIILARFVPIVRTFAPVLAGVGKMEYRKFISFNIFGGLAWGIVVPLLGFFLGKYIPDIDKYLLPIILGIIVLSFVPVVIEFTKARLRK